MEVIKLEVDLDTYRLLAEAARHNRLTLEQECIERLRHDRKRSYYLQALVAELRADEQQRRATCY